MDDLATSIVATAFRLSNTIALNGKLSKSSSSFVERGIRRMLEGVNIVDSADANAEDVGNVDTVVGTEFSAEIRSYIASHFR